MGTIFTQETVYHKSAIWEFWKQFYEKFQNAMGVLSARDTKEFLGAVEDSPFLSAPIWLLRIIHTAQREICFYCALCIWGEKLYRSRFSIIGGINIYPWVWLKIIFCSKKPHKQHPKTFLQGWRVEVGEGWGIVQNFPNRCGGDGGIDVEWRELIAGVPDCEHSAGSYYALS